MHLIMGMTIMCSDLLNSIHKTKIIYTINMGAPMEGARGVT